MKNVLLASICLLATLTAFAQTPDYFELSVQYAEGCSGKPADVREALRYADLAADNGVNGVLYLLAEIYAGNPAPEVLDERNTRWYYTLQSALTPDDTVAFGYYKRCADAAEDSYCAGVVAQWLAQGRGTEKNEQLAAEYRAKAQLYRAAEEAL